MAGKRSWLRLEIGVALGLIVIVAVGLVAPRLWRQYQESRRTPPARELLIEVEADGTVLCEGRAVEVGTKVKEPDGPRVPGSLRGVLRERSVALGYDPEYQHPISQLRVRLRAGYETEYRYVQRVMIDCMHEYVWDIEFEILGDRERSGLPAGREERR